MPDAKVPEAIEVTLDPPSVSVTSGQESLVGVAVRNLTSEPATFDLTLEGPAQVLGWTKIELTGRSVQAFPRQTARANLRLSPPASALGTTYVLGVRAVPRTRSGLQGIARLEVVVVPQQDIPPPAPLEREEVDPDSSAADGPDYNVVTSPNIEVEVEEAPDAPLPPAAAQWRVWVRNAGSVITNFGFGVFNLSPRMVTVDPPDLSLGPGKRASALLTVRLDSSTLPGTYPFYLRTYSFLSLDERTEIRLDLVVRPPGPAPAASASPGPLRVTVDRDYVALDPGIGHHANLTLQNRGGQTLVPELSVAGVPPTWYALGVSAVPVPAMRTVPIDVGLTVPDGVPPGSYPVSVRGQASQNAAATFRVDLLVELRKRARTGPIQASVDDERLSVRPGVTVEARVMVRNLNDVTASVGLQLQGIDPSWFQVVPAETLIFARQQAAVVVRIRPPFEVTRALAGTYAIPILAVSPQSPGLPGETRTELQIPLVGEPRLTLGPGDGATIREATYPLQVLNQTNSALELEVSASDAASALAFAWDHPHLSVPPGAEVTATLRARSRELTGEARSVDFAVVVTGEQVLRGGRRQPLPGRQLAGRFVQLAAPSLGVGITPRSITAGDRGEYLARISNPGRSPATAVLAVADADGALSVEISPAELALAGHEERVAKLVVQPKEKPKSGEQKPHSFTVTATPGPDDDVFAASSEASLVVKGAGPGCILGLPLWLLGLLGTIGGFLGLKGYWRQIVVLPAVVMATLLAFVTSGGRLPLTCPPIPTPWGSSIQVCSGGVPSLPFSPPFSPALANATPSPAPSPTRPAAPPPTAPAGNATSPSGAPSPLATSAGTGGTASGGSSPTGAAGTTPAAGGSGGSTGGQAVAGSTTPAAAPPTPTSSGAPGGATPAANGGDPRAVALATVTAHNGAVSDPSTYGVGPLHVLIGSAVGGDGHSQLAYIFYDAKYLGNDTLQPSGQIAFVGWRDGKTFVLRYGLYRPADPLCCPTGGTADVIYTWSDADGRIVAIGQIPPADLNAPLSRR